MSHISIKLYWVTLEEEEDDLHLADPINMSAGGGDLVSGLFTKQSQPVCVSLSSKYFLLLPATQ